MKRINLLILFIGLNLFALAQSRHEGDTLRCNFPSGVPNLYPAAGGGFVTGNNVFGDKEIAQKFGIDTVVTDCAAVDSNFISEVLVWFGAKQTGVTPDSVKVKIYSVNSVSGAPDVLLGTSFAMPMNILIVSLPPNEALTSFLMVNPVTLTDSFFVSVEFLPAPGDTIGVVSTTDGDASGTRLCWIKENSGSWSAVKDLRGYDIDAAIFPFVEDNDEEGWNVDLLSKEKISWLCTCPNPAGDFTAIRFKVNKPVQDFQLEIFDLAGRRIFEQSENKLPIGNHEINLNTENFSSGNYFVILNTDGAIIIKKIVVIR